jgi:beta-galactosidase
LKRTLSISSLVFITCTACAMAAGPQDGSRQVVSLDGRWQIAEGSMGEVPRRFDRSVPVPGLADMAEPPFAEVGTAEGAKHREAFWYRRTFRLDGAVPAVAQLKIHKACFGTRVVLNGKLAGEHLPCFTPAVFDVRDLIKGAGAENELIVRVGAYRTSVPRSVPDGSDFEKVRYIPGIYDSVELILTGSPHIVRVQAVPDLERKSVRAVVTLRAAAMPADAKVTCAVEEVKGGRAVGAGESGRLHLDAGETKSVEVAIPIEGCRLWSPEDPFLYAMTVRTGADVLTVRFGMRSFRFDPKTKLALLNGRTYPLRGTNVCIYRFFEDPARGDRPWREEWVRRLHRLFKGMNWNSARYCIGFPPEKWYDIADEEGYLIQDEFPIWFGGDRWPAELKSDELVKEYTEWMQERWNHPCVVIWDAQNESVTKETGKAIAAVRGLDLSGRPWDNGWSPPADPSDVYEAHPYPFFSAKGSSQPSPFRLANFAHLPGAPGVTGGLGGNVFPNTSGSPVIINEYGWLWLNRDGTPTTLSKANYDAYLGPNATADQRRELYAQYLAAMTEFWRGHRQVAGVLHFCGLGYSRPGGETSDHFLDLEKLTLDPYFQRYVGDAFSPVGLMLDYWGQDLKPGERTRFPVVVINDLDTEWKGTVKLSLMQLQPGNRLPLAEMPVRVGPVGTRTVQFELAVPEKPGRYAWCAELAGPDGKSVQSVREFAILTPAQREARDGIALGKPVKASSAVTVGGETFPAASAVDGKTSTRWSSEFSDPQWIAVDLGKPERIARVELLWQGAFAKAFRIEVSSDGQTWTEVFGTNTGRGGTDVIRFQPVEARWVRMYGTKRGTAFGYSLWEFKVLRD